MRKIEAIHKLYPNITCTRDGVGFDDAGNQIEYDENLIQEYLNASEYIEKRRSEYPPITDYLDGVVKGNQAQIDAYITACQAVKLKYPKP